MDVSQELAELIARAFDPHAERGFPGAGEARHLRVVQAFDVAQEKRLPVMGAQCRQRPSNLFPPFQRCRGITTRGDIVPQVLTEAPAPASAD